MNDIKCEYPKPLVDIVHSGKKARTKIWSYKKSDEVKKEAKRIVKLHTRDQRWSPHSVLGELFHLPDLPFLDTLRYSQKERLF